MPLYRVEFQVVMTAEAYPVPDWDTSVPHSHYIIVDTPDRESGSRKTDGWYTVGMASVYRRPSLTVAVQAASQHPADLLVPLKNNVSLLPGESIDILSVREIVGGI